MKDKGFLTLNEVAERYRVGYLTARGWALGGHVPAFKIGGTWRVPLAALQRIEAGGERGSGSNHAA